MKVPLRDIQKNKKKQVLENNNIKKIKIKNSVFFVAKCYSVCFCFCFSGEKGEAGQWGTEVY